MSLYGSDDTRTDDMGTGTDDMGTDYTGTDTGTDMEGIESIINFDSSTAMEGLEYSGSESDTSEKSSPIVFPSIPKLFNMGSSTVLKPRWTPAKKCSPKKGNAYVANYDNSKRKKTGHRDEEEMSFITNEIAEDFISYMTYFPEGNPLWTPKYRGPILSMFLKTDEDFANDFRRWLIIFRHHIIAAWV